MREKTFKFSTQAALRPPNIGVFNTGAKNLVVGRQVRKTSGSKERVTEKPQRLI